MNYQLKIKTYKTIGWPIWLGATLIILLGGCYVFFAQGLVVNAVKNRDIRIQIEGIFSMLRDKRRLCIYRRQMFGIRVGLCGGFVGDKPLEHAQIIDPQTAGVGTVGAGPVRTIRSGIVALVTEPFLIGILERNIDQVVAPTVVG